mmetsp:Transcript_15273/g.43497  ORF Transcript_15273/g.43497 Transcript_15273/m.43497 type:complete len:205 (-) Transcript_15273:3019-3633(-)
MNSFCVSFRSRHACQSLRYGLGQPGARHWVRRKSARVMVVEDAGRTCDRGDEGPPPDEPAAVWRPTAPSAASEQCATGTSKWPHSASSRGQSMSPFAVTHPATCQRRTSVASFARRHGSAGTPSTACVSPANFIRFPSRIHGYSFVSRLAGPAGEAFDFGIDLRIHQRAPALRQPADVAERPGEGRGRRVRIRAGGVIICLVVL